VTDHDTFLRAKNWVKELRKVVGEDIVITIAGNKCDMKQKQVNDEEVIEYAKSVGANHLLTSAKANKNVDEAFLDITRRVLEKKGNDRNSVSITPRSGLNRQQSGLTVEQGESKYARTDSRLYAKGGITIIDKPQNPPNEKTCCG
jgi:Ras-related protein Rab-21